MLTIPPHQQAGGDPGLATMRLSRRWGIPFVAGLAGEEVFYLLDEDVAAHVGDGFGEGGLFGAGLDAVLREDALLDAAAAGEGAQTLFFEDCASGVGVEELDLGDGGGADEAGDIVELRANLHADCAGETVT